MTIPVKQVHRLAAVELLYRSTLKRRLFDEEEFLDLRDDIARELAAGNVVLIRAMQFPTDWEYDIRAWHPRQKVEPFDA